MSRAEYMRNYRAKIKSMSDAIRTTTEAADRLDIAIESQAPGLLDRIAELEAEVKHLKAELAQRGTPTAFAEDWADPAMDVYNQLGSFNSRPFTPAPKKGK